MSGNVTRRGVLRSTAGLGAVGIGGLDIAAAEPPQRYIVGTSSRRAVDAAKSKAESVYRVLDFGSIGQAVAGRFSEKAREELSQREDVRYIEAEGEMHASGHGSGNQTIPWGIDRIDADVAHHSGHTGSGIHIAIIDSGIDDDHPDLSANLGTGRAFISCGSR